MTKPPESRVISRSGLHTSLVVRRRTEPAWPEQYDRMLRMFSRLNRGGRDRFEQLDDLMMFFQTAWHLKEWIGNDENVNAEVRESLEAQIAGREALLICRDLAVGGKHFDAWPIPGRPRALLGLATRKRTSTRLRLGSNEVPEVTVTESSEGVVMIVPTEIETLPEGEHNANVETRSAADVASEVIDAWDELLVATGLRV